MKRIVALSILLAVFLAGCNETGTIEVNGQAVEYDKKELNSLRQEAEKTTPIQLETTPTLKVEEMKKENIPTNFDNFKKIEADGKNFNDNLKLEIKEKRE